MGIMKLTSIAIDDEILALNKIKRFISRIDFLELKNSFDNASDAINFLSKNTVDLIFLDIEMPEMTGFQFLNQLNTKPYIVLTTAFDQYALKSYDFEVADYLLKPLQFERFYKSVEKVYALIQKDRAIIKSDYSENEKGHIHIKSGGKIVKIFIDDILYIEGMKDYLSLHTSQQKRIITLMSFKNILEKIAHKNFIRVHKSFIVNADKIEQYTNDEIKIGDIKIPVSRTYKKGIKDYMNKKVNA